MDTLIDDLITAAKSEDGEAVPALRKALVAAIGIAPTRLQQAAELCQPQAFPVSQARWRQLHQVLHGDQDAPA